eukprot:m.45202 g.45202  ORF g.45202 m.45202 type:complete len:372 (+) comp10655_c1_seq1:47-1162(+)
MEIAFRPNSSENAFLPEGLQTVVVDGTVYVAGVIIQHDKAGKHGSLWFYDNNVANNGSNGVHYVSLEGIGRPGFFRSTDIENTFVVGVENRLVLVTVDRGQEWTCRVKEEPLVVFEIENNEDSRIMVNDGTVTPNNDVICGFKDFLFDTKARKAFTKVLWSGGNTSTLFHEEVCANGNGFIDVDGEMAFIHVETASQKVLCTPYSTFQGHNTGNDTVDVKTEVLIDFKDASVFGDAVFHSALMPDGICVWKTEAGRSKLAVSVFDYRPDEVRDGQVIQFDITDSSSIHIDTVYKTPSSPRATHPAIIQRKDGGFDLWTTTADEGLLNTLKENNTPCKTDNIGALFRCVLEEEYWPAGQSHTLPIFHTGKKK